MTFIRLTNIGMSYRERHNIASIIITSVTTHFLTSFYIILVITNINRVVNANSYTFTCSDWHSFSYYVISYVIYTISKWLSVASESLLRARDHGNGPSYIRTIIQINFLRKHNVPLLTFVTQPPCVSWFTNTWKPHPIIMTKACASSTTWKATASTIYKEQHTVRKKPVPAFVTGIWAKLSSNFMHPAARWLHLKIGFFSAAGWL